VTSSTRSTWMAASGATVLAPKPASWVTRCRRPRPCTAARRRDSFGIPIPETGAFPRRVGNVAPAHDSCHRPHGHLGFLQSRRHDALLTNASWTARKRGDFEDVGSSSPACSACSWSPGRTPQPVLRREVDPTAAYVHIVSNETIQGVELGDIDLPGSVIAADMTSTLLSRCGSVTRC
jgi:hypothetical protein